MSGAGETQFVTEEHNGIRADALRAVFTLSEAEHLGNLLIAAASAPAVPMDGAS